MTYHNNREKFIKDGFNHELTALASASEYTATVLIPSFLHVLMICQKLNSLYTAV